MQNLYEPRFSTNQNNKISEMMSPKNRPTEALIPRAATSSMEENDIDQMSLNSMN